MIFQHARNGLFILYVWLFTKQANCLLLENNSLYFNYTWVSLGQCRLNINDKGDSWWYVQIKLVVEVYEAYYNAYWKIKVQA